MTTEERRKAAKGGGALTDLEAAVVAVVWRLGSEDRHGMVARRRVTLGILAALEAVDRPPGSYRSLVSSLSRTVLRLCERGVLVGYYRPWYQWRGSEGSAEKWAGIGSRPWVCYEDARPRAEGEGWVTPRLLYLALGPGGKVDALLTSPEVNRWTAVLDVLEGGDV